MMQRMGFPAAMVERASSFMLNERLGFDRMLDDLSHLFEKNRLLQQQLESQQADLEKRGAALQKAEKERVPFSSNGASFTPSGYKPLPTNSIPTLSANSRMDVFWLLSTKRRHPGVTKIPQRNAPWGSCGRSGVMGRVCL